MNRPRTFAVIILLLGLVYFGLSLLMLLTFEEAYQMTEYAQRLGMKGGQVPSPQDWRRESYFNATATMVMGGLGVACGLGLLWRKEWARKTWLATTILVGVIHLYWLVVEYRKGLTDRGSLVGVTIVGLVIATSWLFLSKKP